MDKIFEPETQEYLKAAGVSEKEINKIMFAKAKEGTLRILSEVLELIGKDKYGEIGKYLSHSPAGDEMGCDNSYITFESVIPKDAHSCGVDIGEITEYLSALKKQI